MSHTIFKTRKMEVYAFCGKNGNASVGITLKGKSTYGFNQEQLTENQVKKLIKSLTKRVEK